VGINQARCRQAYFPPDLKRLHHKKMNPFALFRSMFIGESFGWQYCVLEQVVWN